MAAELDGEGRPDADRQLESTVTPTASFIDPIHKAPSPSVSAPVSNVGRAHRDPVVHGVAGRNAGFQKRAECNLPNGHNLYGNLGLREWIDPPLLPSTPAS
jgi:hypothetical protein